MTPDEHETFQQGQKRLLLRNFTIFFCLYLLLQSSLWWTVNHLPPGKAFILAPRGLGFVLDLLVGCVVFTVFTTLYSRAALLVRKSLGCCLQGLMLFIFVGGYGMLESQKYVAVIQTPTSFIFVRRAPFGMRTIANTDLTLPEIRDTGMVRALEFPNKIDEQPYHLDVKAVWHMDGATTGVLYELKQAIIQAIDNKASK